MPERWETQIRRLRTLEPPEGLRGGCPRTTRRAAIPASSARGRGRHRVRRVRGRRGPRRPRAHPDRGPRRDRRRRRRRDPHARAPRERRSAAATLGTATRHRPASRGLQVVLRQGVAGIADFTIYPPVWEYVVVPPGTPIGASGAGTLAALHVTDLDGEPISGAEAFSVPDADGVYALEAEATWPDGEANFFFGVQVLSNPEAAPDVLRVDCSYGRPTIETAVVRTQPDGLHVAFRGTEGYAGFEIVTPEGTSPEQFFGVGGNFPDHEGASWPIDPGRWEIGCHERGETVSAGDTTTPFRARRPRRLPCVWISLLRPGGTRDRVQDPDVCPTRGRRRPTPDGPRPGRPAPRRGLRRRGLQARSDVRRRARGSDDRPARPRRAGRHVVGDALDVRGQRHRALAGRERRPARDGRDDRADPRRPRRAVRGTRPVLESDVVRLQADGLSRRPRRTR